jgi:peroxiredoxin
MTDEGPRRETSRREMTMTLRRSLGRLATLALLGACAHSAPALADDAQYPAPDFTLESASGDNLRLAELRGDVVLVNFFASWCGPCRQEMPALDDLHQRYEALGFKVLGVNVDEDRDAALALLGDVEVSFPVVFDPDSQVSRTYEVAGMPSTFVVDRDGVVSYVHKGYVPGDEEIYQNVVRQLIRK